MTSTFKLTSAEFKKIFKRPSIFVMAILLVVTILVSIPIFNPTNIVDPKIVYDSATNSEEYYNTFYDNLSLNSKKSFDDNYISTDNIIAYYTALNTNTTMLSTYHSDTISTINKMIEETNSSLKNQHRSDLSRHLLNYLTAYTTLDSLKDFTDISGIPLTKFEYSSYPDAKNYYSSDACSKLRDFYIYCSTDSHSTQDVINYYNSNDCEEELSQILNNGINFVHTTITGLAKDYESFYIQYIESINKGNSNSIDMKNARKDLLLILKTLDTYLETLVNLDYPVIIISNDEYININDKLDNAITTLTISTTSESNLETHKTIKSELESIGIFTTLKNLYGNSSVTGEPTIQQVHISSNLIKELENIKSNVNDNKTIILEKIYELKNDESTTNISNEITNYSLLASSYNGIIMDKIYLNITENHDASEYKNYYGNVFKELNKYQLRERITTNAYYIENNTYSNSFLTNFSFGQNSGISTNAYDFMYFAMELCTIIIIVFAMMLVCNLITGETESGTIKLLLVRPYRRSKILTAKLLATIFFVLTFIAFSGIITFVGGLVLYGGSNLPVLTVLNSNTIFTISPLILMISILCKNYAASISCSLVLLIVNYALNILFGGSFWYTLLPGMNLHMFKYFGNAFTSIISGTTSISGIFQSLLITGIDTSMSLPYSMFMYGIYSLVFLAVSYAVFQKRDF